MKGLTMHFLFYFGFILYGWLLPARSVSDRAIYAVVQSSLRSGNAGALSARFAPTIELIIDTEKIEFTSVEATHAELILRAFFRKHPPRHFQYVYRGASGHQQYSTGVYETNGQTFAVYILMRQINNGPFVINALHFRKE